MEEPLVRQAVPLQPMEEPLVRQAVPLQPMEEPLVRQAVPLQPMEEPLVRQAVPLQPLEEPLLLMLSSEAFLACVEQRNTTYTGEVFHYSNHVGGPSLDLLQQVDVLPVLGTPELDATLVVGYHQSGAERKNRLLQPAGHPSFDAAQDTSDFLGCDRTLPDHAQSLIHQHPQVPLAGLFISQPVLMAGVVLIHVHEIPMGPFLTLAQVSLSGIQSFRCVNHITQLGVI
ncbi:hypothetical protein WISP_127975 [Willisornis vidua]|uniref:Uncharacterized protein n=1 Tax=Willisornis vidua TaxID=1566151 RepID=A0ABQ9CQ65_9PASS|nr:hypothetical protein WISP_127975 [Willisornis vidua]